MSAIDTIARAQAKSAIAKYGKRLTFRALTTGAHDAVTHSPGVVEAVYTLRGLLEEYALREVDGTNVMRGDMKVTVAAKDNEVPKVGWTVDLDVAVPPARFTIIAVGAVYSGEQVALYICQVRK